MTMEFPHLFQLVENNQFDTIYHEHFSYLSLHTAQKFSRLKNSMIFDVEEITTHGGSLRIFAKHAANETHEVSANVAKLFEKEKQFGLTEIKYYLEFPAESRKN